MFRLIARSVLPVGLVAIIPLSCGGDDARTFNNSGGSAGAAAGSGGTGGSSGGTSGGSGGGSAGGDASAGSGGGTTDAGDAGKTCSSAADCDDGAACNGIETCSGGACKAGTLEKDGTVCSLNLDGGVADSGVTYNCIGGDCRAVCTADADCDDNDACTGKETCSPTTKTCQAGTPLNCDDSNDCTENKCDANKGCHNPLIDIDQDGHAATALGSCGDDCNDNDKTTYKGAQELCDGKDNDCDGKIDGSEPLWYPDCDKDTFAPTGAVGTKSCNAPTTAPAACSGGGWTEKAPGSGATDCFDSNASVHPMTSAENNAAWSTQSIAGATTAVDYDYNCDGAEEKRYTTQYVSTTASCSSQCTGGTPNLCYCSGTSGYTGAAPACGASGTYTSCSGVFSKCLRTSATRVQECR